MCVADLRHQLHEVLQVHAEAAVVLEQREEGEREGPDLLPVERAACLAGPAPRSRSIAVLKKRCQTCLVGPLDCLPGACSVKKRILFHLPHSIAPFYTKLREWSRPGNCFELRALNRIPHEGGEMAKNLPAQRRCCAGGAKKLLKQKYIVLDYSTKLFLPPFIGPMLSKSFEWRGLRRLE